MDLLSTVINGAVLVVVGIILGWLGKGRIDALDRRIEALDRQIGERFADVDRRFDRLEQRVDRGFDSLRSDLTRVALAVGVRPEAEAGGA